MSVECKLDECIYRASHPPFRRMKCKNREWRVGRKICGSATSFEPACYNVTMYHAENMLQTNASKHAYRSKSYIAYIQNLHFILFKMKSKSLHYTIRDASLF